MEEKKASKLQYSAMIILSAIIIISVIISTTLALFTSITNNRSNFNIGQINVVTTFSGNQNLNFSVAELTPAAGTTRTITITKPTTSDSCYVRIKGLCEAKTDAQISYTVANSVLYFEESSANWTSNGDYLYYDTKLTTASNFATLTLTFKYSSAANVSTNYTMFKYTFTVEAVQEEGITTYDTWKAGSWFTDLKTITGSGNLPS